MKERRIEVVSQDGSIDKLREIHRPFISKDILTEADISGMAEALAKKIMKKVAGLNAEEEQVTFIANVLQVDQILYSSLLREEGFRSETVSHSENKVRLTWKSKEGHEESEVVSEQDLEPFLQKIRIAVLNKLSRILPKNITAQIIKKYTGSVSQLEDGTYYRHELQRGGSAERIKRENTSQTRALKYLHSLPEHSPYLYYGTIVADPQKGSTIGTPINLTTLWEILEREEKPQFSKIIKYVIDIVQGHRFLLAHDLILFDNHIDNMGIERTKDRGILFDLDGLRRKGDETAYVVPSEYLPPERRGKLDVPATEADITFEMGTCLQVIIGQFHKHNANIPGLSYLLKLSTEMTAKNPEKRPTLEEVERRLREITQNLDPSL